MCINGIQEVNVEYHQHKLNPVPEPNVIKREYSGALKVATCIKDPVKGKRNNNKGTSTRQ